jgi:DNA gyrase/topoisomerase IV subunit B
VRAEPLPHNDGYDASMITVLEFDDAVRKRPAMYFGLAHDDPGLPTAVLCTVLGHATHPDAKAPAHSAHVRAEVAGDLTFAVTDDILGPFPSNGFGGTLIPRGRWGHAVAAAVSTRTTVEVWRDGQGLRQELARSRPVAEPVPFEAHTGAGIRVAYELDREYFGAAAAIAADLSTLDICGPYCAEPGGPGDVVVRDLRRPRRP